MTLRRRLKNVGTVILILACIGAPGFVTLSYLKRKADMIVRDTLPGLSYGGEFVFNLSEGFNNVLLLASSDIPADVDKYQNRIEPLTQKDSEFLGKYEAAIFAKEDRQNFDDVVRVRKRYLEIRDRVRQLVRDGKRVEVVEALRNELAPAYADYARASKTLLDYNIRIGQSRGREIMRACTFTQIAVGILAVVVFFVGFWMALLSPTDEEERLMGLREENKI